MGKQKQAKQLPQFATLNAAYCSGFFIDDDTLTTTMCLLFDKIWLLNHTDLVIEFAKKFQLQLSFPDVAQIDWPNLKAMNPAIGLHDPFAALTSEQYETAMNYLFLAYDFCKRYSELVRGHVLTDLGRGK